MVGSLWLLRINYPQCYDNIWNIDLSLVNLLSFTIFRHSSAIWTESMQGRSCNAQSPHILSTATQTTYTVALSCKWYTGICIWYVIIDVIALFSLLLSLLFYFFMFEVWAVKLASHFSNQTSFLYLWLEELCNLIILKEYCFEYARRKIWYKG